MCLPQLLKYATGSSPTNADLLARMDAGATNGAFAIAFRRNTNAVDVTLWVEAASALDGIAPWRGIATNAAGSWGGAPNVREDASQVPACVLVWDPAPASTNDFLRLRVSKP